MVCLLGPTLHCTHPPPLLLSPPGLPPTGQRDPNLALPRSFALALVFPVSIYISSIFYLLSTIGDGDVSSVRREVWPGVPDRQALRGAGGGSRLREDSGTDPRRQHPVRGAQARRKGGGGGCSRSVAAVDRRRLAIVLKWTGFALYAVWSWWSHNRIEGFEPARDGRKYACLLFSLSLPSPPSLSLSLFFLACQTTPRIGQSSCIVHPCATHAPHPIVASGSGTRTCGAPSR